MSGRTHRFLYELLPEILFAVMLPVLLLPIWNLPFFPTLDAPGHVYNGVILRDLIAGNSNYYHGVFELNTNWSPNWLSQLLLAGLSAVFSPINCERILHSLYIILFATGFRFFTHSFNGFPRYFGLVGFVFVYNYTFILGFLNFNLSMAIFFWCIGLFHRAAGKMNRRTFRMLGVLLVVLYSCHLVGIVAFFVYAAVWMLTLMLQQFRAGVFFTHWRRLWLPLMLSFIPSAFLLLFYFIGDQEAGVFHALPADEIMRMWTSQAGLNCFHESESGFTRWNYYVVMGGLLLTPLLWLLRKKSENVFEPSTDWWRYTLSWLTFSALMLCLAHLIPDASSGGGGMLTIRLVFISGMFALLALISLLRAKVLLMSAVLVLLIVTADKVNYVKRKQSEKAYYIEQIEEASKHFRDHGVLIFLDFRGGWPLGHYSKVLAAEHRLIALDNLGAHKPFSPIQWSDNLRKNDQQLCWVGDQWNCDPKNLDVVLSDLPIYILKWGEFEERESGGSTRERWVSFFDQSCTLLHDDSKGMQVYVSEPERRMQNVD
jgi:hypothetical protein